MYRKPKFLEELHAIREEMSREADYDMELFAEIARAGVRRPIRGVAMPQAQDIDEKIDDEAKANAIWSSPKRLYR